MNIIFDAIKEAANEELKATEGLTLEEIETAEKEIEAVLKKHRLSPRMSRGLLATLLHAQSKEIGESPMETAIWFMEGAKRAEVLFKVLGPTMGKF